MSFWKGVGTVLAGAAIVAAAPVVAIGIAEVAATAGAIAITLGVSEAAVVALAGPVVSAMVIGKTAATIIGRAIISRGASKI